MTQTQFLLFLLAIIPLGNCLLAGLAFNSEKFLNKTDRFLPVLFLANLIGLCANLKTDDSYLVIAEATRGISIGFAVDELSLIFLFLLNFFWLVFTFYSQRFLQLSETKNVKNFKVFFLLIISLLNLIILSKNLLSILFFYNCLVLLCHFFAVKFLHQKEGKFSYIFTFLLYLESIFLFLAIVATYKFTGQIDFADQGIVEKLGSVKYILLLVLYFSGLFLSLVCPSYLLYREINFDLFNTYALFFLAYALGSFYIFLKVLSGVFGFYGISDMLVEALDGALLHSFEILFLLNIIAVSIFLLTSKSLKASFFYLFFEQFLFALFSIFIFAAFDPARVCLTLFSFLFSLTLIFLCCSNFILYLKKAENKSFAGLFYDLKVTSILLIFAVANLMGLAPTIGAVSNFFLIKIFFKNGLILAPIIFTLNFVTLLIFSWRIFLPLFLHDEIKRSKDDELLAKNIDSDSSLILSALVIAIIMFLLLIFFPVITKFFV